jgi:hypothetical protein
MCCTVFPNVRFFGAFSVVFLPLVSIFYSSDKEIGKTTLVNKRFRETFYVIYTFIYFR